MYLKIKKLSVKHDRKGKENLETELYSLFFNIKNPEHANVIYMDLVQVYIN